MAGSDADFDSAWTQFGLRAKLLNEIEKFGRSNSDNVLDMVDAIVTGTDGEFTPQTLDVIFGLRRTLAGTISQQQVQAVLRGPLLEMGRIIGSPTVSGDTLPTNLVPLLEDIRDHMVANSLDINVSGQTVDTSFSTSGTGNGDWVRLIVTKDGEPYTVGADAITFTCEQDQLSGAKEHQEVWVARGTDRGDALQLGGVGTLGTLTTLHAKSSNLLKNASFDLGTHTDTANLAATTSVTNWTVTDETNWESFDAAAAVYRDYPGIGSTTSWGLRNTADDAITQVLKDVNPGANFRTTPHVAWVRWKRLASATGTLTLTLGSQTAAATIGSATNDQWNTLLIPASGSDTKAYYDNWRVQDATFAISTSSLATGTLYIDDAGLSPMTRLGETWFAYIGGSTPALKGATAAVTDQDGTRGINAYWLWRGWGVNGHLPTDGSPTQADPS